MRPNRKIILPILVLVVVLLIFFGLRWYRNGSSHTLQVSGNIELTQVNISFKMPGLLAERNVEEGALVKKGMKIAQLDQEQLLHQREQLRAAVKAAESRLEQLRINIAFQNASVDGQ